MWKVCVQGNYHNESSYKTEVPIKTNTVQRDPNSQM